MDALNIAVLTVSGLVLTVGVFSKLIRASILSGPIIGLSAGILSGPIALNIMDTGQWENEHSILWQISRMTLAVGLVSSALSLPKYGLLKRWKTLAVLLLLAMPAMWLSSGLLVYWILGTPLLAAFLLGAVITPTDPILVRTLTEGELAEKTTPARLRYILTEESGLNDGLALPFVLLVVDIADLGTRAGATKWIIYDVLRSIGGAVVFGIILGYSFGLLLRWAESRDWVDRSYILASPVGLAFLSVAGCGLLGFDGILADFLAGMAFAVTRAESELIELSEVQNAVEHYFAATAFFLLGVALPWQQWFDMGWRAPVIVFAVLFLRRIPAVALLQPLMKPIIQTPKEAVFIGWFGPIGISALFYAMLVIRRIGLTDAWGFASLIITSSIVIHAVTASIVTRRAGNHTSH